MRFAITTRITNAFLFAAIAASIAACDSPAGFTPLSQPAAGVYSGSLDADVNGVPTTLPLYGIISESNELQMFSPGGDVHIAGPVTVDLVRFEGRVKAFSGVSGRFFGMDGIEDVILDGVVAGGSSINGDFVAPNLVGTFAFAYELVSDELASLDFTNGTWMAVDGLYSNTLVIDAAGAILGTDSNGCSFTGQLSVSNDLNNAYAVTATVANCGVNNGDFTGHAFLTSVGGLVLDQMTLGMSNDTTAYSAIFDKM